jgi:hypothetical protein
MRNSNCWRWLLIAGAALAPTAARAQSESPVGGMGAVNVAPDSFPLPLPLTSQRPEAGGLFTAAEFVFMHQTRPIQNQRIMVRGFFDSTGNITGVPGTFTGSAETALDTGMLGRTTWEPGYKMEVGYKFTNGVAVSLSNLHLMSARYSAGATLVTPFFKAGTNLAETFISAPVYNFPVDFAGPGIKTAFDGTGTGGGSNTYGIWNAASEATESYKQHYDQYDITGRIPVFSNEYAKLYSLVGARSAWLWERYDWRTVSRDINGAASQFDAATYSNLISNRMYGPFLGCGQECYLGGGFALSADATGAILFDRVRAKAKYQRDDGESGGPQSKDGVMEYRITPNTTGSINLWWFPAGGIEMRVGYNALMFFNTVTSKYPVGFNYSKIDAPYETQWFRMVHGINAGISFNF